MRDIFPAVVIASVLLAVMACGACIVAIVASVWPQASVFVYLVLVLALCLGLVKVLDHQP